MHGERLPRVFLQARKARPFFGRHPWVYESTIDRVDGNPGPGALVRVDTFDKEFVAYGLFNPHSKIRVRLYEWNKDRLVDEALVAERIESADRFRRQTLQLDDPQGGCRLVYSEADQLSGLIVDRYADVIVVQFAALAMSRFESTVVSKLNELYSPRTIVRRTDKHISQLEGMELDDQVLSGDPMPGWIQIVENGMRFFVDPVGGQKTGAYLDQRDNRMAIRRYVEGRDVLDAFCHGAAFGISAMKAKASSLTAVDASGSVVSMAQRNVEANDVNAEFICSDASEAMERLGREGRRFGVVICDPPKFARAAGAFEDARRGYERINRLAIELLEPGGILVTCSCSGHVGRDAFVEILVAAAQKTGRHMRILERRGQAPDHPVSAFCLETDYLKCAIAYIE